MNECRLAVFKLLLDADKKNIPRYSRPISKLAYKHIIDPVNNIAKESVAKKIKNKGYRNHIYAEKPF